MVLQQIDVSALLHGFDHPLKCHRKGALTPRDSTRRGSVKCQSALAKQWSVPSRAVLCKGSCSLGASITCCAAVLTPGGQLPSHLRHHASQTTRDVTCVGVTPMLSPPPRPRQLQLPRLRDGPPLFCTRLQPHVILAALPAGTPPPPHAACTCVGLDAVCRSLLPP